ncbi:histone acetyltransferase HPA2 and related acetyltransferases [Lachnospiraceae bacterium KM106-2]|nr:histone acetyltransferase HPA2 and related acetyltransferases [Lachnospiraceae bacterium KM106-2]
MNLRIEKASIQDIDELEQLYNDLNDHLAATKNYPGWKKDVYPIRCDAEEGLSEDCLFIAKYDDKIVGSFILNHKPESGYETAKWLCDSTYDHILVIHTLVVHPAYTKQGIATKLLQFADEYAKENHINSLRLDVYVNNTPAISLYERYGYQYITNIDEGLGEYGLSEFRVYEKIISNQ